MVNQENVKLSHRRLLGSGMVLVTYSRSCAILIVGSVKALNKLGALRTADPFLCLKNEDGLVVRYAVGFAAICLLTNTFPYQSSSKWVAKHGE